MATEPKATGLVPPLHLKWRNAVRLSTAVPEASGLYGITPAGKVVALSRADGSQRWESERTYLTDRLAVQGFRLFAYEVNRGLVYLDDEGSQTTERLALSFSASSSTHLCTPVADGRMVYLTVNRGLIGLHQDDGLLATEVLSARTPHSIGLVAPGSIVAIDNRGVPTRYRLEGERFVAEWEGAAHGVAVDPGERPFVIVGDRLLIGLDSAVVAYDLGTGTVVWRLPNVRAEALIAAGGIAYAAARGAALWAIRPADGATLWQRQYVYDVAGYGDVGVAVADGYLYVGGTLSANPDGASLIAVRASDGACAWMSRAVRLPWAAGRPVSDGTQVYVHGGFHTGAYEALASPPRVTAGKIAVNPNPLRGPRNEFGSGQVEVDLPVAARVSIAPYGEVEGLGPRLVDGVSWSAGRHSLTWNPSGSSGFAEAQQFGFMLVDVEEEQGAAYTQVRLVLVNTFPDILHHWARTYIEAMVYHKYVSGYPDQTFKPNNLVTRAESSTIIAQTLGLDKPSPGFETRFTDITGHWARDYIMALEEQGIVGGFAEPDGTFTFRPDLHMTRAQEARILVNAYQIPAAPEDFATRFTDIAGHWAEEDIKALEASGYVNGFREPDGTYTYRPEQNLTRAELCTVVGRILVLVP